MSERDMAPGWALKSSTSGSGKAAGSRLAAARTRSTACPAAMERPARSKVVPGPPQHQLHGAVVAQEFLDSCRDQVRPVAQPVGRLRVLQEGEDGVADEVGGRLVAGDQEQGAVREEFVEITAIGALGAVAGGWASVIGHGRQQRRPAAATRSRTPGGI
ncbi:hypothetical protein ACWC2H_37335 [Streptomyces sp. 900105755]